MENVQAPVQLLSNAWQGGMRVSGQVHKITRLSLLSANVREAWVQLSRQFPHPKKVTLWLLAVQVPQSEPANREEARNGRELQRR